MIRLLGTPALVIRDVMCVASKGWKGHIDLLCETLEKSIHPPHVVLPTREGRFMSTKVRIVDAPKLLKGVDLCESV